MNTITRSRHSRPDHAQSAFTRVDLITCCAILTLLAFCVAPLRGIGKADSDAAICFNNNRKLIQAWQLFTMDNSEKLAGAIHGGLANQSQPTPVDQMRSATTGQLVYPWAQGWQSWDNNLQNTNLQSVINPRYAALAEYFGRRKEVVKCPADTYLSGLQISAGWKERARSYSMNIALGDGNGGPGDGPWGTSYRKARKLSELVYPPPGGTWVFVEEHPDSMNDPSFFDPQGQPGSLTSVDVPANFHDGAANFSFADGHIEQRRWIGAFRTAPVVFSGSVVTGNNQSDLKYLFDHTPRLQL
jgi:prepilin-type processing-associated H-X9-DG protein